MMQRKPTATAVSKNVEMMAMTIEVPSMAGSLSEEVRASLFSCEQSPGSFRLARLLVTSAVCVCVCVCV